MAGIEKSKSDEAPGSFLGKLKGLFDWGKTKTVEAEAAEAKSKSKSKSNSNSKSKSNSDSDSDSDSKSKFKSGSNSDIESDIVNLNCCSDRVHIAYRGVSDDRLYLAEHRTSNEVKFFRPIGLRVYCAVCRKRLY